MVGNEQKEFTALKGLVIVMIVIYHSKDQYSGTFFDIVNNWSSSTAILFLALLFFMSGHFSSKACGDVLSCKRSEFWDQYRKYFLESTRRLFVPYTIFFFLQHLIERMSSPVPMRTIVDNTIRNRMNCSFY